LFWEINEGACIAKREPKYKQPHLPNWSKEMNQNKLNSPRSGLQGTIIYFIFIASVSQVIKLQIEPKEHLP